MVSGSRRVCQRGCLIIAIVGLDGQTEQSRQFLTLMSENGLQSEVQRNSANPSAPPGCQHQTTARQRRCGYSSLLQGRREPAFAPPQKEMVEFSRQGGYRGRSVQGRDCLSFFSSFFVKSGVDGGEMVGSQVGRELVSVQVSSGNRWGRNDGS